MPRCVTAGLPMGQLSFSVGALPVIKTNEKYLCMHHILRNSGKEGGG